MNLPHHAFQPHAHDGSTNAPADGTTAASWQAPGPSATAEQPAPSTLQRMLGAGSARRRHSASVAAHRHRPPGPRAGGGSPHVRMLAWGLVGAVALIVVAVGVGGVQLTAPDDGRPDAKDSVGRDSWSYYHDEAYDTDDVGAKWATDRSRSSDLDDAALGSTSRWEYDGPYRYGPYGSDGIGQRARGRENADPLASNPGQLPDVFSQYGGDLDPSGGQPVGAAPSSMTNPYFDPYAGYSNPYSNRLRMSYGEGYGRGALADF